MCALLPLSRSLDAPVAAESAAQARLRRLFLGGFTAADIAEDLASFDADQSAESVAAFMDTNDFDVVGIRLAGLVAGYAERASMGLGSLGEHLRTFSPEELLPASASLAETVAALERRGRCFVHAFDRVAAIVTPFDVEKPAVRMWLFGMITMLEMQLSRRIRSEYGELGWRDAISPERLRAAEALRDERARRTVPGELADCLQFCDKGDVLLRVPGFAAQLGFESNKQAKRAFRGLQRLRNNLAHTQELLATDWEAIVRLAAWLGRALAEPPAPPS